MNKQIGQCLAEIPQEYWQVACWSWIDKDHKTFAFRVLTITQRLIFTYRYYLYQVDKSPVLTEWYEKKQAALKEEVVNHGP